MLHRYYTILCSNTVQGSKACKITRHSFPPVSATEQFQLCSTTTNDYWGKLHNTLSNQVTYTWFIMKPHFTAKKKKKLWLFLTICNLVQPKHKTEPSTCENTTRSHRACRSDHCWRVPSDGQVEWPQIRGTWRYGSTQLWKKWRLSLSIV